MTNLTDRQAKFLGGMIGSALGDAIGEMAFHRPTKAGLLSELERQEKLVYTDDTAMAIGLGASIAAVGGLDPHHLGDTFRASFVREPWRGYAAGPPTVFAQVEQYGISYAEASRMLYGGQGSFGNGAAMRIVALGLFFHDAPDLYNRARLSAQVTHAHPIGVDGAAVQARAVAQAMALDPALPFAADDFLQTLLDTARTPEMEEKLVLVRRLSRQAAPPQRAAMVLGQGVAVQRSLPFAIFCFARHPTSFQDCLFCAALNGGDRDTLGAMACAISGAYLGIEAIPEGWRGKLENQEAIEELAVKLAGMSWNERSSPACPSGLEIA
jgi:poly(ADP-ribose) glycohydrolase ARH3